MTGSLQPTDAELGLLRALWRLGPSTVREVHEASPDRGTGYTTALKLLQIMHKKGLVERDESNRSHRYSALVSEAAVQGQLLDDLRLRAFEGSTTDLVMRALDAQPTSRAELELLQERVAKALEASGRGRASRGKKR